MQYLRSKLNELKEIYNTKHVLTIRPNEVVQETERVVKPSPTVHPAYQARHTRVGVWPLWDHTSVKTEDYIISRIVQLLHPDHYDTSSSVLVITPPVLCLFCVTEIDTIV